MGSQLKHRYDITMSKRTRKPVNLPLNLEDADVDSSVAIPDKISLPVPAPEATLDEEKERRRLKLKQLINGDGKPQKSGEESKVRSSLGQHFNQEEKQLQLVKKKHQDGKLKGMVSRYAKVLSHLVKAKGEPRIGSQKKHFLSLKLQP